MSNYKPEINTSTLIQDFFCKRLMAQRSASPQTIASYRDTFLLLFRYAREEIKKDPAELQITDLNTDLVLKFLDYLEKERGNSERSRNLRLAAIRAFMRYASYRLPASLAPIREILAIPLKRFDRPSFEFLSREEVEAIITAPDKITFSGHRDFVLFMTLYNTGARVSEIISLRINDICLHGSASILIHGKGRKQRAVPLWQSTAKHLKKWLYRLKPDNNAFFFPNRRGESLSRSGVEYRLRIAVKKAAEKSPTLKKRQISPHTFRHYGKCLFMGSGHPKFLFSQDFCKKHFP